MLGAIITAGGRVEKNKLETKVLSQYDFKSDDTDFKVDTTAEAYLVDSLRNLRENGIDLVPLTVHTDGSCLPHSLSRSLVGQELFFDALRADLVVELTSHANWYREHLLESHLYTDDRDWKSRWDGIIASAQPTHGKLVGLDRYLEPNHIQGFANLLMRPILLVDQPACMGDVDKTGGMFLPLRHTREKVLENNHGKSPSPIIIGWQNSTRNHYISLVGKRFGTIERFRQFDTWFTRMTDEGESMELFQDMLRRYIVPFLTDNKPTYRLESSRIFLCLLKDIQKCFDDPSQRADISRFKLDKPGIRSKVLGVRHGLELLEAAGFRRTLLENIDGTSVDGLQWHEFPPAGSVEAEQDKCKIAILIRLLESFDTEPVRSAVFPGCYEITSLESEKLLFGSRPKMLCKDHYERIASILRTGPTLTPLLSALGDTDADADADGGGGGGGGDDDDDDDDDAVLGGDTQDPRQRLKQHQLIEMQRLKETQLHEEWLRQVEAIAGKRPEGTTEADWNERVRETMTDEYWKRPSPHEIERIKWERTAQQLLESPRPARGTPEGDTWAQHAAVVMDTPEPPLGIEASQRRDAWNAARSFWEWEIARSLYAEGSEYGGSFWSVGSGSSAAAVVTSIKTIAKKSFKAVTKISWETAALYFSGPSGAIITCPSCKKDSQFPASGQQDFDFALANPEGCSMWCSNILCNEQLSVRQTIAGVLDRLVQVNRNLNASCCFVYKNICLFYVFVSLCLYAEF